MLLALMRSRQRFDARAARLRIVFNNVLTDDRLSGGWGFACVVEGFDRNLLFDTGGNGDMLLQNMRRMGVRPHDIGAVMLSHLHADHMGGLDRFLAHNPDVTLYAPASIARALRGSVPETTRVRGLGPAQPLLPGMHSTGEIFGAANGAHLGEQGLILDTPEGNVLVTGCAHPGLGKMVASAREYLGRDIDLVVGGFHLRAADEPEILRVIAGLKRQGVVRVAPSHCTGDLATGLFRQAWGDGFVEGGCGATVELVAGRRDLAVKKCS